jgi:Rap1a immunity proteins
MKLLPLAMPTMETPMKPPYYAALAIALAAATPIHAKAESDLFSGNRWQPFCAAARAGDDSIDSFPQGVCVGVVAATERVLTRLKAVCPPSSATHGQNVRIVVRYMQDNPQVTHQDIRDIAVDALRAAWPCKEPQAPAVNSQGD